uniref:Uroporphyrinogen decarboxylase (URO-D) domain-containing protein n=2 Tax=Lotharella globosa TaxID=91324 RepID=A0A7S3Z1K8_9EUKA|eukprot:CAMPEP_0167796436 /NCGR_PEP_ID=MMETSP0111_2-20121227/15040_1 /TAXON_ID=91324 /ORGANISM="Lotharella globosa, Strain CCCM811" /LENGTH=126 /DNA_ID=CAMNT_0007690315 /DNA_START=41 /DNA_END=421 /DNA_ORIENTATION=-
MHTAESNGRENALEFIKKYPEAATKILDNATKLVVKYLIAKVEAGAQMLQVFDSWAGILSKDDFDTFSKPYLLKIAKEVKAGIKAKGLDPVPMTVFPRGCGHSLSDFEDSGHQQHINQQIPTQHAT